MSHSVKRGEQPAQGYQQVGKRRIRHEDRYIDQLRGSIEGRGFLPTDLAQKSFDTRKKGFE